jgi:type II secretory pathway pseudopilin PulG
MRPTSLRAMTLLELMLVLAMTGIVASMAMISISDMIKRSRYAAEKSTLFHTVREARDGARESHGIRIVQVVPPGELLVVRAADCFGTGAVTIKSQHLNAINLAPATLGICFEGVGAARRLDVLPGPPTIQFEPVHPELGGAEQVQSTEWAGLSSSWNEIPPDGYGAAGCDPDEQPNCGA